LFFLHDFKAFFAILKIFSFVLNIRNNYFYGRPIHRNTVVLYVENKIIEIKILLKNRDFFLKDKIVSNAGNNCTQKVGDKSNSRDHAKIQKISVSTQ